VVADADDEVVNGFDADSASAMDARRKDTEV